MPWRIYEFVSIWDNQWSFLGFSPCLAYLISIHMSLYPIWDKNKNTQIKHIWNFYFRVHCFGRFFFAVGFFTVVASKSHTIKGKSCNLKMWLIKKNTPWTDVECSIFNPKLMSKYLILKWNDFYDSTHRYNAIHLPKWYNNIDGLWNASNSI